jgi:dynein heavy chain
MEPSKIGWRDTLVISWLNKQNLEESHKIMICEFIDWLLPPLLKVLRKEWVEISDTSDCSIAFSFLNFLESMINELPSPDKISSKCLQGSIILSVIWTIGGTLTDNYRSAFNSAMHNLFLAKPSQIKLEISLPDDVYYQYFDTDTLQWKPWTSILPDNYEIAPDTKYDSILVPTLDTARYTFILQMLVRNSKPVLFVGPTGTGKSMYIRESLMNGLDKEIYIPNFINFSAQTSAYQTQAIMESKVDKRRKGVYGPAVGKKCIFFVDDLNMPAKETYGAQPPIELLRQWMDHGGWYNLLDNSMQEFVDIQFVCAMGPSGGGRSPITNRVLSH